MFFDATSTRVILGLNVLAFVFTYTYGPLTQYGMFGAAIACVIQVGANLALAAFMFLIHMVTLFRHAGPGRAALAFLLASGLSLLITIPACFMVYL
ncbi:MAG: hypothetical protein RL145_1981 [Pseudomonadota bacterium]